MNLNQILEGVESQLNNANLGYGQGTDDSYEEALRLVFYCMGFAPDKIFDNFNWYQKISADELQQINHYLALRIDCKTPFPYLVNEAWFAGNQFYIDSRAIIPRSYFTEWIPDRFEPWVDSCNVTSILDICTGSGCIAISSALEFSSAAVVASDLSEDALQVARINIAKYQLQDRVQLVCSDGFNKVEGKFDLILCNPPYVSAERMAQLPDEYQKEPEEAFCGGVDGLDFILPLLMQAEKYLTTHGTLIVEAGSASHALESRLPNIPFNWLSTEFDEMVLFLLTREELVRYKNFFSAINANKL